MCHPALLPGIFIHNSISRRPDASVDVETIAGYNSYNLGQRAIPFLENKAANFSRESLCFCFCLPWSRPEVRGAHSRDEAGIDLWPRINSPP